MPSRRGNWEHVSRPNDARDSWHVGLAWLAAPGLVKSRNDVAVEARPVPLEGGAPQPRVLLVDENHLLARSLSRWFARFGCLATAAFTRNEAAALTGPFDCGVFDIEISAANGVVLAESLLCAGTIQTATFYCESTSGRLLRRASQIGPIVFKNAPIPQLMQAVRAQIGVARSRSIDCGS